MENAATTIPNHVVDVWMLHVTTAQFRMLLVMLRHGLHGASALPRRERYRLPELLGIERDTAYRTLNALVDLGAVEEIRLHGRLCYRLRVDWMPPKARLEDAA